MRIGHRNTTLTLMPLFLAGVLCNMLTVEYQQQHICAVKGSSVVILCSFYRPANLSVERVVWGHVKSYHLKGRWIYDSYSRQIMARVQYLGDRHHNCSLRIHQVKHIDAGIYIVRLNSQKSRWPCNVCPTLKVVDLSVSVTRAHGNGTTKEGDSVSLTCTNGCDGGHLSSALTWFKNGERIYEGAALHLSNVSSTNSGNYTCSLKTHTGTTSRVIHIDVEYGPKNTSVSVRPSMEVDAGSNITLICSSHANPPVENYTWFKIHDHEDDVMAVGHQPVFFSGDGGQYLCSAANKHGSQNSSVVTLKTKPCWPTFTRDVLFIAAGAVLLIGITVLAVRRLNNKRMWATKTDCEEDMQNTDYVNWLTCDNNQSQEGNQCEGGTTELVYATVYFKKSNMVQQMDSHNDGDVIYSTVCKYQVLNPSNIEPP